MASMNRSIVRFEPQSDYYEEDRANSAMSYNRTATTKFSVSTQTGQNVGKVRWLEDKYTQLMPDPFATGYFVSSSCGGTDSEISLWRLNVESDQYGQQAGKVQNLHKIITRATVTDIVAVSNETFAITTSKGSLGVYKSPRDELGSMNAIHHVATKDLHHLRGSTITCPARALATNGNSIITVGEDGSIFETSAASHDLTRSFERADPLSIYCVQFVGRSEILTGNGGGQLKCWDLRSQQNSPMHTMNPNVVMNNLYGAISIAVHPSQSHLVIVGYQSGCMDLFDLRLGSGSDPIANLSSDSGSLSEMYFHQVNPDHFFSCSQSGVVCQWYPAHGDMDFLQDKMEYTPDVNIEFLRRGLAFKEVYGSSFPVNSLSISKHDRLVCGSDSGIVLCTEVCANN